MTRHNAKCMTGFCYSSRSRRTPLRDGVSGGTVLLSPVVEAQVYQDTCASSTYLAVLDIPLGAKRVL